MKTWSKDTPLSRIPNETQKAHNALMDYFLMGAGRSLEKLHQKYIKTTLNKPPTIHLRILAGWSSRYHWQARIAQQNANDNEIEIELYRQRHMSKEEVIARLSDQARGDMGTFAGVRTQADLAKHPHSVLINKITQHYNQTERGEGEDKETELKARITLGLYSSQKALELLARHYGLFEADNKSEVNVNLPNLDDWKEAQDQRRQQAEETLGQFDEMDEES